MFSNFVIIIGLFLHWMRVMSITRMLFRKLWNCISPSTLRMHPCIFVSFLQWIKLWLLENFSENRFFVSFYNGKNLGCLKFFVRISVFELLQCTKSAVLVFFFWWELSIAKMWGACLWDLVMGRIASLPKNFLAICVATRPIVM